MCIPRNGSLVSPIKKFDISFKSLLIYRFLPDPFHFLTFYWRAWAVEPAVFPVVYILLMRCSQGRSTCSSVFWISCKLAAESRDWIRPRFDPFGNAKVVFIYPSVPPSLVIISIMLFGRTIWGTQYLVLSLPVILAATDTKCPHLLIREGCKNSDVLILSFPFHILGEYL